MMKNFCFLIFFLLLSCKNENTESYLISGEVSGAKTGKIVLAKLNLKTNEKQKLDSTNLENGRFTLKGKIEKTGLYTLFFQDSIRADFFLEPEVKIKMTTKKKDTAKVFGGIENELFRKNSFAFDKEDYPLLLKNSSTAFSAFNAYYLLQYVELSNDSLDVLVNSLKGNAIKSDYYEPLKKLAQSIKNTKVGGNAPDFTAKTVNGNPVKLSDFRGKLIVLEFWASWCAPCRANNPKWQKLYEKYKGGKFDMVSVSFDHANKCDAWKEAIAKDKLTWNQLSNCDGWNEISDLYGIKSVPQTFLINPDGKILAKNFEPEQFDEIYRKFVK